MQSLTTVAFINNMFGVDGLVLLALGLLIFGRRLPEVGKNIGQTIVEFKKGLSGAGLDSHTVAEQDAPASMAKKPAARLTASNARPAKSLPETEEI